MYVKGNNLKHLGNMSQHVSLRQNKKGFEKALIGKQPNVTHLCSSCNNSK